MRVIYSTTNQLQEVNLAPGTLLLQLEMEDIVVQEAFINYLRGITDDHAEFQQHLDRIHKFVCVSCNCLDS